MQRLWNDERDRKVSRIAVSEQPTVECGVNTWQPSYWDITMIYTIAQNTDSYRYDYNRLFLAIMTIIDIRQHLA